MSAELTQLLYGLLRSLGLLALAMALGSVAWNLAVLRAWRSAGSDSAIQRSLRIGIWGAVALAAIHLSRLFTNAHIVEVSLGAPAFPAFMQTHVFAAEIARATAGVILAAALFWLAASPSSRPRWVLVIAAAMLVVASGAWLVHGASRTENAPALMTLTAVHQLGAAVWAGGVLQLVAFWRLSRRRPDLRTRWPEILSRFTAVGIVSIVVLISTGLPVAITYVGSWYGLIGSAYGSVLLAKGALLMAALALAFLNFRATRRQKEPSKRGDATPVFARAPHTVETEFGVLFAILFVASALAALPPAVDVKSQYASVAELVEIFRPKIPRLVSPTFAEYQSAGSQSYLGVRTEAGPEELWSDFNHNVSGVLVFLIGVIALADRSGRVPWARYWPLGFVALAAFVLVRADTEGWPYGDMSWLDALQRANTFQHKLAFLLTAGLGVMEWRARAAEARPWLPYVFPVLCFVGGIMMLTHAHSAFEVKTDYLVQASHTIIGVLAVLSGCGRWLELRLSSPFGRVAGHLSIVFIALIGAILAFYREPVG
ncbi:MAG: copper resistance protein CopD [Rhodospirillales bacterium]|nr:copper resistance protein CopD [Rhodospirillales bacterium]